MTLTLFPENTKTELTHPVSGDPTGLTIELLPSDHDDIYNAALGVVKALRSNKEITSALDVAVSLESRIKVAVAAIAGWEIKEGSEWEQVFKRLGFEDTAFSKEKAIALLSMKTAAWIRAQIEAVIADKERAFQSVSTS